MSGRSSSLCVTDVLKSIHTEGDVNPPAPMCTTFHASVDAIVTQIPCSLVSGRRSDFAFESRRSKSICTRARSGGRIGREECGERVPEPRGADETRQARVGRTRSKSMLIGVTPSRRGMTQTWPAPPAAVPSALRAKTSAS